MTRIDPGLMHRTSTEPLCYDCCPVLADDHDDQHLELQPHAKYDSHVYSGIRSAVRDFLMYPDALNELVLLFPICNAFVLDLYFLY